MNKNYILVFFSLFLVFIIAEFFLRTFNQLIPSSLIYYYPGTSVKKEIAQKRNLMSKSKVEYIKDEFHKLKKIPLPQSSFNRPIEIEDLKDGVTELNFYKNGFCNKKINTNKKNIIAIGDSLTWCTAVKPEHTWIKNINILISNKFEKINYGVACVGPFEYTRVLRKFINPNTKLIIVMFAELNDVRDLHTTNRIYNGKNNVKKKYEGKIYKLLVNYIGKSHLINYLWASSKSIGLNIILKKFDKYDYKYFRKINDEIIAYNINNNDLSDIETAEFIISNKNNDYVHNLWKKNMIDMNRIAKQNNSKILFLYSPIAAIAFGNQTIFNDKRIGAKIKTASNIQQKLFKEICDKNRFYCLNLTKYYVEYNKFNIKPSHFRGNLHLTPDGHAIVSDALSEFINKYELF